MGACSDQPYGESGEARTGPYHAHAKGVIGYAGNQVSLYALPDDTYHMNQQCGFST